MNLFCISSHLHLLLLLYFIANTLNTSLFIRDSLSSVESSTLKTIIQDYLKEIPNDNFNFIPLALYNKKESDYTLYKLIGFYQSVFLSTFYLKYTNTGTNYKGNVISYQIINFYKEVLINERKYFDLFEVIDNYFETHFLYSFNILKISGSYEEDIDEYLYWCSVRLLNGSGDHFLFINQHNDGMFTVISNLFP